MVHPLLAVGCLASLAIVLLGPVPPLLARARWAERSPRSALVLWFAVVHTAVLSTMGAVLALAVAPLAAGFRHGVHVLVYQVSVGQPLRGLAAPQALALALSLFLVGWPTTLLVRAVVRNARVRHRHRGQVDLLTDRPGGSGGVHVLDHPEAVVYCLPGLRPRIVITSGLVGLLGERELAAVLDHERAHARGRHHLILLPFNAFARAVPCLPAARLAGRCASRLVEMLADDHARRRHGGKAVASALVLLATHRTAPVHLPEGALGAAEHEVVARVRRLTVPGRPAPLWQRLLVYAGSAALMAGPLALMVPCMR